MRQFDVRQIGPLTPNSLNDTRLNTTASVYCEAGAFVENEVLLSFLQNIIEDRNKACCCFGIRDCHPHGWQSYPVGEAQFRVGFGSFAIDPNLSFPNHAIDAGLRNVLETLDKKII